MKCKNWSNKLNNFVVRKLKSFKINGQQQVLSSSTMPAMPKEKQTTPISLDENNFDEIKMKEQLNISNTSIGPSNSTQSSVSRLLRRCNSNNIQQQSCCCQLDDCCPILATSTATGSIQDTTTTTNSIINNSNIQQNSSSKLNKQQSQMHCNCHSINCNSSSSTSTILNTTTTTTATATTNNSNTKHNNLGKTNILDYKSSLREFMNSCGSTAITNSTSSPTTSTTISSTSSSTTTSYNQSGTSSLSTFSPSSATSTQTTITTTIKNICENNCHCSRKNSIEQNRMQYQYCNGDTTTTTTNNKNPNKKLLENNTSSLSCCNSNNSSNSCNLNTTAQTSNSVMAAIPTTSSGGGGAAAAGINSVPSTSSSSGILINGVNSQQSQQQQPQQIPKKTPNDFIFKKYIGEGSFSTVYRAKEVRSKKEVAIKVCEKNLIIREKKQEYVRREREVMHRMSNCPGFVNLYCTFQDETRLYFVMTYAKNGDLLPHIIKVGSFDLEVTQHYAAELVLACENMHKRGIVHRDLKPENILLDENMHTLIADFGSAKILDNNRDMYLTSSSSTSLLTAMGGTGTTSTIEPSTSSSSISTPTMTTSSSSSKSSPINNSNCSSSSSSNNNNSNNKQSSSSSATTTNNYRSNKYNNHHRLHNDSENEEAQTKTRHRRRSFVGTAQYVSPEILQDGEITPSCDLWALGCIIYQMISGLPPFRGNTEFLIFKQILNLNLEFPEGFDENAKDLVQNLLKLKPEERLGAQDKIGCYESIRTHPFFDGINWDSLRSQTPPTIYPYLPGTNKEDDLHSDYRVPDNLEPGFGDKRYTELIGWDLVRGETGDKTEPKKNFNLTETDMKNRLEAQKADKWNAFTDGELILKKGFVNKRKGLFARKRMLLLLTGPKLVYVDPVAMVKKGEIPWSPELRVEPKNFKIFFVHTPNRTYYLEDPDGYALKWVNAIENVRQQTYSNCSSSNLAAILQQ